MFRPILHVPRHPLRLAGFGLRALLPATAYARRWRTDEAQGLFAGVAAHCDATAGAADDRRRWG